MISIQNVGKSAPGIYIILNRDNFRMYVGSAACVRNRLHQHRTALKKDRHENTGLQKDWNRYGEDQFRFSAIMYCSADREELLRCEQFYIDWYQATQHGYNRSPSATSTLGYRFTKEQREGLSRSLKGTVPWNKGQTGIYTEETIAKMAAGQKGRIPWNRGIPRTLEERRKMSEAKAGRTGHRHTEESRRKIAQSKIGKPLSVAHRKKLSDAAKRRYA